MEMTTLAFANMSVLSVPTRHRQAGEHTHVDRAAPWVYRQPCEAAARLGLPSLLTYVDRNSRDVSRARGLLLSLC